MLTTLATTAVVAHAGPWAAGWGWAFFLIPVFWILVIGLIIYFAYGRKHSLLSPDSLLHERAPASPTDK